MKSPIEFRATPGGRRLLAAGLFALFGAGCSDDVGVGAVPTGEETVRGLAISEAQKASPDVAMLATDGGPSVSSVAYVSAAPGTFPTATHVRIGNITTGVALTQPVAVVAGGFDPVPIPARPDDRLELSIFHSGGGVTYARVIVPFRRPPTVVRTNPPKGRTDVAVSIQPTVVFTEPVDPQTLGDGVQLLLGGSPVPGRSGVVPGNAVTAVFVPDQPLAPLTEYELVVWRAVRDLEGEALEDDYRATFITGAADVGHDLLISTETTGGAFDLDGYRVRISAPGRQWLEEVLELNSTVVVRGLPPGDVTVELVDVAANCSVNGGASRTINVSSDNPTQLELRVTCTPTPGLAPIRIVYSRATDVAAAVWNLWAVNADGTGLLQLTSGSSYDLVPIVSPNGSRIAFSRGPERTGFWGPFVPYAVNADGGGLTRLTNDPEGWGTIPWSWSPDGSHLVMQVAYGGRIEVVGSDGTGRHTLLEDGSSSAPVWSPDGRLIAFRRYVHPVGGSSCENPTGGHEIWVMNADGSDAKFLRRLGPCASPSLLSWSSDGRILYSDGSKQSCSTCASEIWSMKSDGSDPMRVLGDNPSGFAWGAFSPDGELVTMTRTYYVRDAHGVNVCRVDVYLLNVGDGSLTRVTADGRSQFAVVVP